MNAKLNSNDECLSEYALLLARLMGHYCFAFCHLSSAVVICWRRLSSSVTRLVVRCRRAGRVAGLAADTTWRDSTVTSR